MTKIDSLSLNDVDTSAELSSTVLFAEDSSNELKKVFDLPRIESSDLFENTRVTLLGASDTLVMVD